MHTAIVSLPAGEFGEFCRIALVMCSILICSDFERKRSKTDRQVRLPSAQFAAVFQECDQFGD
jgi:hypothetical protein